MEKDNREYTNGEITVFWKPSLCCHSGICYTELVNVFDPRKRPWVDMKGASTAEIINTVDNCPTDALTYKYNKDLKKEIIEESSSVTVKVVDNGPFLVSGSITLINSQNQILKTGSKTSLCACGKSQNKPFCDGNHYL